MRADELAEVGLDSIVNSVCAQIAEAEFGVSACVHSGFWEPLCTGAGAQSFGETVGSTVRSRMFPMSRANWSSGTGVEHPQTA